ncbi:MAG TPA: SIR2 family protein [Solirubrobacterales bacterium]|nr:SIR2 family protein [Solirubrobacterales bacterium]
MFLRQRARCVAVVGAGGSAPILGRGRELVADLENEFRSEEKAWEAELFRLQRVYDLDPEDFETRIAALSRTPEVTEHVRRVISERYALRHPTILGYELLAHLLKHRFLDAIISFNFDELLDQSLDDELGPDAYHRLVSDRDCFSVVTDPDASGYLPLYIKLHGTATEPESLRLTREAYYKLSQKLMEVVEKLLRSEMAVIVNVGSAMTGFDLHRLLRIPEQLEIYDLSHKPLSKTVREAIATERLNPKKDSLHDQEKRDEPKFFLPADSLAPRTAKPKCDGWLKRLVRVIGHRSGKRADPRSLADLVDFRSADRHEAIADVLGPAATLNRWIKDPIEHHDEYVEYLRKRTIVELAFSGAKARGLAQLSWLALDRCGTYFELYRREGAGVAALETWNTLRLASGLKENKALPDVVESDPDLCLPAARPTLQDRVWSLREYVPNLQAEHVISQIGAKEPSVEKRLARALRRLQDGSEVEIDATDDQICAKAFDSALLLPTITSLSVYTQGLFKDLQPRDEVYIICETGEWLLKKKMVDLLSAQEHIEVITAFELKSAQLKKKYGSRLALHTIDPWRHNRHMTIVCRGGVPQRAVYFARRLRAPNITPVYLKEVNDAERVKRTFELMRTEAEAEAERQTNQDAEPAAS